MTTVLKAQLIPRKSNSQNVFTNVPKDDLYFTDERKSLERLKFIKGGRYIIIQNQQFVIRITCYTKMPLLHELYRCHYYTSYTENRFSAILRRFSHNGIKKYLEIIKFLC